MTEKGAPVQTESGKGAETPRRPEQDLSDGRNQWFWERRWPRGADRSKKRKLIFEASSRKRLAEAAMRQSPNGGPPPPAPPGGVGTVNWTPIGPSVINNGQSAPVRPLVSGRINAIAAGPGNRVYVGAANGGAWYSGDGGLTWAPLDDYATSPSFTSNLQADALSVGALAVAFGSGAGTDDVYVGTGEPGPSDGYFGVGIKHSGAGGAPGTWALEATNLAGRDTYRLVTDPDVAGRVWAATSNGVFQRPSVTPFATWTQITSATFANSNAAVSDFAIGGTAVARAFYAAFRNDKVYRFDGTTWIALTGIPASPGRIALAVGESDPTVVYALIQNGSLYRLIGTAFQPVANVPSASVVTTQGWYDLVLAVDPSNASIVYLAGSAILYSGDYALPLFKGSVTNVGGTWTFQFNPANTANPTADATFVGGGIHADAHSLAFAVTSSGSHDATNVWVGSDGGLFQSTLSGALNSFVARNLGLAITEMTFFGQRQDSDSTLFAGNQDNGNVRFHGEQACYEDPEGDGGGVAIDPNDEYKVMRQYVRAGTWQLIGTTWYFFGSLSRTTDGGATGFSDLTFPPYTANTTAQRNAVNTEDGATSFYAPIASIDAGSGVTRAAFGTNRLWLTQDWGGTWVTLPTATNPYTPPTPNAAQDVLDGNYLIAVAFASGTRIFAATQAGVWRFDLAGGTWTRTQLPTAGLPPSYFIAALAVADPVAGSIYVTLGYSSGGHVYYLDGAATTWTNAGITDTSGTIDVPANALVVDPASSSTLYVGTDVGVWRGTRSGSSWSWVPFSPGLPECAVLDLQIHRPARLLRAATHGRGMWEIEIPVSPAVAGTDDPDIYLRVNYADTGRVRGGTRYAWVEGAQDPTAKGFNVYHWMSADIKVRRGSLSGLPVLGAQASYLDYAFNIGDYIDTSHIETADQSGSDRIFVEVHNRGLTPLPAGQVRVLLLITQVGAGLPALPNSYATHINAGDTSTTWLAGTAWKFADPSMPYRVTSGILDVRTPQVVEFDVDISTLGLTPGDHVCAAAFITTVGTQDQLTSTNINLDQLTMSDKHVAHRNLHLVAAGARPAPSGSEFVSEPQTFLIDFNNPSRKALATDLVFQRTEFKGELLVTLPKLDEHATSDWKVIQESKLEASLRSHLRTFLARLGEGVEELGEAIERAAAATDQESTEPDERAVHRRQKAELDRTKIFVAPSGSPLISNVSIPGGGMITAAVTAVLPPSARPGDRFRFDVLQAHGDEILGGVTYIIELVERKVSEG